MFALSDGRLGLRFFPGFGQKLFFYNNVDFDIAGHFGVAYALNVPTTIDLDWRPRFENNNNMKG